MMVIEKILSTKIRNVWINLRIVNLLIYKDLQNYWFLTYRETLKIFVFLEPNILNMGKIIGVANQKGGVGKTTTSVNLASALGVLEKKVLLIDADPQANATSGLGVEEVTYSTYDLLEHHAKVRECILPTSSPNVDIIPSHIDLVAAEIELVDKENREYMLKEALKEIKNEYDYIIIDCAPSLGLITINALTAADSVIIPVQCEYFALEGLGKLLNTIKNIQSFHNPNLDIEGLLLTMFDSRLRLSNQVVEETNSHFPEIVFETIISRNTRLSEAPSFGESILKYDAESKGAVQYIQLAEEILLKNEQKIPSKKKESKKSKK
jgi:parA-like ATPase